MRHLQLKYGYTQNHLEEESMIGRDIFTIIDKVAGFVDKQVGGLSFTSDKGSFPKLPQIDISNAPFMTPYKFRFFSQSLISEDNETIFSLQGNFGFNTVNDVMEADQQIGR